jgi:hypothetical protein
MASQLSQMEPLEFVTDDSASTATASRHRTAGVRRQHGGLSHGVSQDDHLDLSFDTFTETDTQSVVSEAMMTHTTGVLRSHTFMQILIQTRITRLRRKMKMTMTIVKSDTKNDARVGINATVVMMKSRKRNSRGHASECGTNDLVQVA